MRFNKLRTNFDQVILRLVVGFVFIIISGNAYAQYNGHNLRGDFGLFSGSQPGPGWYAGFLGVDYDVDSLRDRNGNELASGGNLNINAIAPYFWWVTDKKVFGGNYSIFASPSWTDNSLEAPTLGISSDTDVGAGDL